MKMTTWLDWLSLKNKILCLAWPDRPIQKNRPPLPLPPKNRIQVISMLRQLSEWADQEHDEQIRKFFWNSVSKKRSWNKSEVKILGRMKKHMHDDNGKQAWLAEIEAPELAKYLGFSSLWVVGIGEYKTPIHHFLRSSHSELWKRYKIPAFGSETRAKESVLFLGDYNFAPAK